MRFLLPLIILVSVYSCSGNKDEQSNIKDTLSSSVIPDSSLVTSDQSYFWSIEDNGRGELDLKKVRPISADSLNYNSILGLLNSIYPEIKLDVKKLSNDTLFLKANNGKYLTQQMGSTGSFNFLKEVTYNLTELNNIHYVNFDFVEGDHAQPGTYSRSDFITTK